MTTTKEQGVEGKRSIYQEEEDILQKGLVGRLIADIEEAVRRRQWYEVQSLAGRLLALGEGSDSDMDRSSSGHSILRDRLIVLQAGPLVREDEFGLLQELPPIDLRWEKEALISALDDARGTKVEVIFDIATLDRFNALLAEARSCSILHFTGHGMSDGQLVFGDGHGLGSVMKREKLVKCPLISELKAVFVSACHSRSIGEAFVEAGVKHVVCCTDEAKLKDSAAILFTSAFYRALANKRTLIDAFKLAKMRVLHDPHINDPHLEVNKFILLPERGNDYHNVQIFFTQIDILQHQDEIIPRKDHIEKVPMEFLGRNVEAYQIIKDLSKVDVVHLVGTKGFGKKSLAKFVASYVRERKIYSNVLCWCDSFVSLQKIHDHMTEIIEKDLGQKGTLLVINVDNFAALGAGVLSQEIQNILMLPTKVKALLVSEERTTVELPTVLVKTLILEPLTFESTVTLFAALCPYVNQHSKHADNLVYFVHDFLNLVFRRDRLRTTRFVPRDIQKLPLRGQKLFEMMGRGIPEQIRKISMSLLPEDYKKIIKEAKKYDVILEPFETRRALDLTILHTECLRRNAIENEFFDTAQYLWEVLEVLKLRLPNMPSKEQLEQQLGVLTAELMSIDLSSDRAKYMELYRKISQKQRQLMLELNAKDAMPERLTKNICDGLPAANDNQAYDGIPTPKMIKIDDSTVSHAPIFQQDICPLMKYHVNSKYPFLLHINHGPAQCFSYSKPNGRAAVVVASNEACTGGQGILRAVTTAGGQSLLDDVKKQLPTVMDSEYGVIRCLPGDAKVVGPGKYGDLKVPYVMFAVGPWFDSENEEHRLLFLVGAYRSAFTLAKEYKLEAMAFSLIGSSCRGGKGWKETISIGLDTIIRYSGYPELREIHLFAFTNDQATELSERSAEALSKFEHMEQLPLE